jgi:hypothetical protein
MCCSRREFSAWLMYSKLQAEYFNRGASIIESQGVAMKNSFAILFLVAAGAFAASPAIFAHHSSAGYDMEHPVSMKGVVTNIEWTNPHVFIFLDVKDDSGAAVEWRVEGNSPNMLVRTGWKREMIKSGDQLTVNGAPERNGTKVLRLITLTLANGQKYDGQGFK